MLNNVIWHALSGSQAALAQGDAGARRFGPGLPALAAFADPQKPDLQALAVLCAPDERVYVEGWSGAVPAAWRVEVEAPMLRMAWPEGLAAPVPDARITMRPLGSAELTQAIGLTALTRPGPFGTRSFELGTYLGCFDAEGLVAMAGERLHAAPWREISAVCVHPRALGRGLARALVSQMIVQALARGERPFLHVLEANTAAVTLYERMGFAVVAVTPLRVIARA
jgi:ribosomal protein S18 acetylase RimI-like enzyme